MYTLLSTQHWDDVTPLQNNVGPAFSEKCVNVMQALHCISVMP